MRVELQSITPNAERNMVYIARVSNPNNQNNQEYARLLKYCITHQHWSVFEQAHMTLEIETSRAISAQILRHRSFSFQEFSQRYADVSDLGFEEIELRKQAEKNRQSSLELLNNEDIDRIQDNIQTHLSWARRLYLELIDAGVAKECARMVLPLCTTTKLYMTGNIRSWIHYLQLRTQPDTQLEHRLIAVMAQQIFIKQLPIISEALGWIGEDNAAK